jgi:hypothetical protein
MQKPEIGLDPNLHSRGGCGIKKISAKPALAPQSGWSLTTPCSGMRFGNFAV